MSRYLNPKADLTFKRVFCEHKHLCISLLNALLPLKKNQRIVSLEFLPSELVPRIEELKDSVVDLRCTDQKHRQFIVEMQMEWTDAFATRILFNASKAYVGQVKEGKKFSTAKPVYSLNLINAIYDRTPGSEANYYHEYGVYERDNPTNKIEGLTFVLIELPKFKPKLADGKAVAKLHKLWLRFLTEIDGTEGEVPPPELLECPETREAVEILESSGYTPEEVAHYDRYWDTVERIQVLFSEKEAKALAKGRSKGRAEGRVEGRAEARKELAEERAKAEQELVAERAKAEAKAEAAANKGKLAIARALLAKGLTPEFISEVTELSLDKIREISYPSVPTTPAAPSPQSSSSTTSTPSTPPATT
jgi:predicted transposase/invertase (TIGR01784 family)